MSELVDVWWELFGLRIGWTHSLKLKAIIRSDICLYRSFVHIYMYTERMHTVPVTEDRQQYRNFIDLK